MSHAMLPVSLIRYVAIAFFVAIIIIMAMRCLLAMPRHTAGAAITPLRYRFDALRYATLLLLMSHMHAIYC